MDGGKEGLRVWERGSGRETKGWRLHPYTYDGASTSMEQAHLKWEKHIMFY